MSVVVWRNKVKKENMIWILTKKRKKRVNNIIINTFFLDINWENNNSYLLSNNDIISIHANNKLK